MLTDIAEACGFRDRFTEQRDEAARLRHLYERWRRPAPASASTRRTTTASGPRASSRSRRRRRILFSSPTSRATRRRIR
ncbi:hypothetical protein [Teichococcus aestuarii]|uniref:hypothetical protein n=1 Tax=Teichococcus aestuarii TaxID=568898 RepID=UPI0036181311